jgi:hypothetical protein
MRISLIATLFLLAACADNKTDYDASARCQAQGQKPGTAGYEQCVREERSQRMMEQQRREYEQMKQQDRDFKMRRY